MSAAIFEILLACRAPVSTLISQATGTAIGGEGTATNPGNAFDGNQTTFASGADNTAAYVGKNWGAGSQKLINRFTVKSPTGRSFTGSGAAPTITWTLSGSSDGSAWTTIATGSFSDPTFNAQTSSDQTIGSPGSTYYQYHRVRLTTGSAAGFQIAELTFYELI